MRAANPLGNQNGSIIVVTLIMLVLEKTREIAVLKLMGSGVPSVMKIFVLEGLAIGVLGTIVGLVLGLQACWIVSSGVIPLPAALHGPLTVSAGQIVAMAAIVTANTAGELVMAQVAGIAAPVHAEALEALPRHQLEEGEAVGDVARVAVEVEQRGRHVAQVGARDALAAGQAARHRQPRG
mgnify:CR=1 FL=1